MRTLALLATSTALAAAAAAPAAMAAGNPSGTGPPNQNCQSIENNVNLLPNTHAANSPGSVFNENGSTNPVTGTTSTGGTGGNTYNAVGAPSQYDVACFQTSTH